MLSSASPAGIGAGRRASDKVRLRFQGARGWTLAGLGAAGLLVAMFFWRSGNAGATHDGAPSWSPDGERLAFSVEQDGQTDVFVMSADGTSRVQLTTLPGEDGAPAFSPDGNLIAFETDRDGNLEIYVMTSDGRNARRISTHPAADRSPAWSPDGRRLVFLSSRDRAPDFDVHVMNADGTGVRRLTHDGNHWAPQFSPDGRVVAVQSDRDIRAIDLEDGTVRRLTFEPENGMSPSWSPDGTSLVFATTRNARLELFTMREDGTNQELLVSMPGASALDPRWSPDGTRVAFVHVPSVEDERDTTPQSYAIYVIDVATRRVRRLSP